MHLLNIKLMDASLVIQTTQQSFTLSLTVNCMHSMHLDTRRGTQGINSFMVSCPYMDLHYGYENPAGKKTFKQCAQTSTKTFIFISLLAEIIDSEFSCLE